MTTGTHRSAGSIAFALRALRYRNYRLFFTGQVISNIGTWMQRVAQAWLILSLTHSPVAVGILALCQLMPFTLFSLVAGVVVDRLDSWRTVVGTQCTQMFLASTIAVIALAGVAQAWEPIGEHDIRGMSGPVAVHRLVI